MNPAMHIPPGEVWPAMVTYDSDIIKGDSKFIIPETSNTIYLAPAVSTAALKLPAPSSFRLVTLRTAPPLPPTLYAPDPSAPGNEVIACPVSGRSEKNNAKIMNKYFT